MYMNNREYIKAEEQTGGGTMINFVQSPYPPVTQVMKNGQKDEWISMQVSGVCMPNSSAISNVTLVAV